MSRLKSSRDEESNPKKKKKASGKAVSEMNLLNETYHMIYPNLFPPKSDMSFYQGN